MSALISVDQCTAKGLLTPMFVLFAVSALLMALSDEGIVHSE